MKFGKAIRHFQHLPDGYAVWDLSSGRIRDASENAWRWLYCQLYDDQSRLIDVVPVETFGPLPQTSKPLAKS